VDLAERLQGYVASRLPNATAVAVSGLDRIFGGGSRETYRFVVSYREGGRDVSRRLILRRDPPASLIETERRVEFAAYRAFWGTRVPVPEPLWLEEDSRHLDHPFFIMEEITGCEASPMRLMCPPWDAQLAEIGRQKWTILGEIAKADPQALGLVGVMPAVTPETAWERELTHWVKDLDHDEIEPQPITRAAIRWLRRNPPPPAQRISVVHADYRTGNFLVDEAGTIRGILDWELAHLGDPLEDLAWGINRVWCWNRDDRAGGLLPKEDAIRLWEASSGLRADREALRWWELFSCVKGQAIWLSAAREYHDGTNRDPIMALAAWMQCNSQDRAILELLGHLA
jgi:aminoglycoside phosphotransferase (APT) family kinase protein